MDQPGQPAWPGHSEPEPPHATPVAPLVGTWEWDVASGRVEWSEALQRLHGLTAGSFGGSFDDFARDIDPGDRERVLASISEAVEGTGYSYRAEYLVRRPDGAEQPIQAFGEIERGEDGRAIRVRGICMDASFLQESERRRRAEQALSEALFDIDDIDEGLRILTNTLGESLPMLFVGYWQVEDSGLLLRDRWVSPAATDMLAAAERGLIIGRSEGLAGRAIGEARPVWEEHLEPGVRMVPGEEAIRAGARSAFSFPIRSRAGIRGALTCISSEPIHVDEGWERTLESMHSTVAQFMRRSEAREELRRRALQQTVVAEFGLFAFDHPLPEVLDECVRRTRDTLDVEFVKVLELLPGDQEVRLVAGVGWRPGLVGTATVGTGLNSQAGYTLASREPVIVEDLPSEVRFHCPPLLAEHEVLSGMSVVVGTSDTPWGVLAAHSKRRVNFTPDDAIFLTSMANALASAIEQARHVSSQAFLLHAGDVLFSSTDYRQTLRDLARLVTEEMGDWCSVHLVNGTGDPETLEVAHRDPAKVEALRAIRSRDLARPRPNELTERLLAGRSVFLPHLSPEMLARFAPTAERRRVLEDLGLQAFIAIPLRAHDRVFGAMLVASAESGRRYTRAELATLEELGRRAGIAIENAQLYEQLREAVRSREDFVSIASHELRSPLTSILGFSRRLMRRGEMGESAAQDLATISSEAERMRRTLSLFLEMAGLESGRFVPDVADVDLCALLDSEREALERESPEAVVSLSLPEASLTIRTDADRVRHIVSNLLNNAVKYGGEPPEVEVTLTLEDGVARFSVRDNGPGIAEEDQPNIFQRHYRTQAAASSGKKGLGLGLYLSRQIALRLGGSLTFESRPGEGTEFRLELPESGRPQAPDALDGSDTSA